MGERRQKGPFCQGILSYASQQLHPYNSAQTWIVAFPQAEYRMLSTHVGILLDGEGRDSNPLNVVG